MTEVAIAIRSLPKSGRAPRASISLPGTSIALLTFTSKMGCWSWGMTAGLSCPFAITSKNARVHGLPVNDRYVCESCYAKEGMYRFPAVRRAYQARYEWAVQSMRTVDGRDLFIRTMVTAIRTESARFGLDRFRIADSGDFFSPAYVDCWYEIARQLPGIRFWAPTKSWRASWLDRIVRLNTLPNVSISPSAARLNEAPPVVPGLSGGSMVITSDAHAGDVHICPARDNDGHCGSCDHCYGDDARAYPFHGMSAHKIARELAA